MKEIKEPSEAEIKELRDLVNKATQVGCDTIDFLARRLSWCVTVGERLIEIKKRMPHGRWKRWLEEQVPKLSSEITTARTFQNWMRLAKGVTEGTINIADARSVRQAYQLAEILPEAEANRTKLGTNEPLILTHALRLVSALAILKFDEIDVQTRCILMERLKCIADAYYRLQKELRAQY